MFGLFKKVIIEDPRLGPMQRHGKRWVGVIRLPGLKPVELDIEGTKEAPHSQTLACAYELPERLQSLIPAMSKELLDHLEPYQDALRDPDAHVRSEFENPNFIGTIMAITTPVSAWQAANIMGIEIGFDGSKTILLVKMDTLWDPEHTVGAYFEDWQFRLLNGSV